MASSKQACVNLCELFILSIFLFVFPTFGRIGINYNRSNLKYQFKILQLETAHPLIIKSIKLNLI